MNTQALYSIASITILLHIFISVHFTKETYLWEPILGRRIALIILIWLMPFIGAFICYKYLNLDTHKKNSNSSETAHSAVGAGLIELDSMFNPGQKHVAEARQEVVVELRDDEKLINSGNKRK